MVCHARFAVIHARTGMIFKQPYGEKGELDNVHKNLLFTGRCIVRVRWCGGIRGWEVEALNRGGGKWDKGVRILSPAN
jgi:hypothetical protein